MRDTELLEKIPTDGGKPKFQFTSFCVESQHNMHCHFAVRVATKNNICIHLLLFFMYTQTSVEVRQQQWRSVHLLGQEIALSDCCVCYEHLCGRAVVFVSVWFS